jgi:hypothetical protein
MRGTPREELHERNSARGTPYVNILLRILRMQTYSYECVNTCFLEDGTSGRYLSTHRNATCY